MRRWPFDHLRLLMKHRELFVTLLVRDVKVRYRQSVLGIYWALLHPLAIALVLTLAFSIIMRVSVGDVPYFLFALSGLLVWNFFAHGVADATESLVAHANLVTKVPFPRELLPLSAVAARCVDYFFSLAIVVALSLVLGQGAHVSLLWVPLLLLLGIQFTAAIGLLLAMGNLYYRDVRQLVTILLPLWMYLTPIIYPPDVVPEAFRFLLWINPVAGLVEAHRDVILYGQAPEWLPLFAAAIVSSAALALAYLFFKHRDPAFAEVA